MATYVNYAERNAADQVDWSAIGTSISKTLLDERDRRENAKKEIADATGVSINTALGRMRYALINLRKMMGKSAYAYDTNLYQHAE